jgi:hypothetical protein
VIRASIRAFKAAAAPRGLAGGGVQDLPARSLSWSSNVSVVYEEIGVPEIPATSAGAERARISGIDNLPAGARLAQHVIGPDLGLGAVADDANRLPRWSRPKSGPGGTPRAIARSRLNLPGRSSSSIT